jgi:uncharacterized repeat protein (TIGR01451 family)
MRRTALALAISLPLTLALASTAVAQSLRSDANNGGLQGGLPAGGPYVPPGSLFDNEQSDGTTSLASQNSSGTLTARSADDFAITQTCASGVFEISQIRAQLVQADAAPQAFAIDLYADNGAGTAPVSGITPLFTFAESGQTSFGPFGAGTSLFEATFPTPGLTLDGNTTYWISAYGSNAAANPSGFNNFFAASLGATGSTDNGVIIAPGAGVADWTPVETVLGPPALAFSFAVDGTCAVLDADLSVAISSSPDSVPPGGNVTFIATVTNNGPADADTVALEVALTGGGTPVSVVADPGGICSGTGPVQCSWAGDTAVNASHTVTIVVSAPQSVGSLGATATASSNSSDAIVGNNSATAGSGVVLPPPAFIPTASHYGLGLLAAVLGLFGFALIRRHR